MVNQLLRSVQSIPANIAEGYGRYDYQESMHFCEPGTNISIHEPRVEY